MTPGYHTKVLFDTNILCTSKYAQNGTIFESEGSISQTDITSLNQNKRIELLPKENRWSVDKRVKLSQGSWRA